MSATVSPDSDRRIVTLERHGHVAVATIRRPEAMNAVNAAVAAGIGDALAEAEADDEVRALVITGEGRAFCAGADLKALACGEDISAPGHPEWGFAGYVRHFVSIPTIAAVNGFALGGGTEIVLASDLAVVDEGAALGLPEVKRGLLAAAGGVIRTQRQIPLKLALEVALTGDPVEAERAVRWGLANRLAPAGSALDVAVELGARIAANAPLAVRETKKAMHGTTGLGSEWDAPPWEVNDRAMGRVLGSADFAEGTRAFAEKRAPRWTGR
ncbi:enoyl-CoA hydratase-related protein [Streptomyces sp. NPDC005799]|uniref:enoyl-CoA hydratase-related protein n=1 Tax=Streptomyces sp. NPDC005799 TaxID=3154678 RepID=UPI0033C2B92A